MFLYGVVHMQKKKKSLNIHLLTSVVPIDFTQ